MRTEVGYAGGRSASPTYHALGGHAEATRVVFDPAVLSLDELLAQFWAAHDPTDPGSARSQYRAALFLSGEHQRAVAEASAAAVAATLRQPLLTPIELVSFHPAEAYHQKWYLRRERPLFEAVVAGYPDEATALASTAATRANAYVAGNGDPAQLARDLPMLGLPPAAADQLAALHRQRHRRHVIGCR